MRLLRLLIMMTQRISLFGLLLSFGCLFTMVSAQAEVITFQLQVAATSGPLAGQTATGTFSIDSNINPPGGGQIVSLSFTDVAFRWEGIQYTAATTHTGFFDIRQRRQ